MILLQFEEGLQKETKLKYTQTLVNLPMINDKF